MADLAARRLTTMFPEMPLAEAVETICVHSVAGRTGDRTAWVTTRPSRAPHHTISDAGLIGGGHVPVPGGVSLAHHACCFWIHSGGQASLTSSRGREPEDTASPPARGRIPASMGLIDPYPQDFNRAHCLKRAGFSGR